MNALPVTDLAAALVFACCWLGYAWFYERHTRDRPSLLSVLLIYRRKWMREMYRRDNRVMDVAAIANLFQPCTFFASTTILILGGVLALLAAPDGLIGAIAELPFAEKRSIRLLWELKIFMLVAIFAYAFFKFTWALRQYSTCTVIVASTPTAVADTAGLESHLEAAAQVASLAGENFNFGIRAYYFAVAGIAWFLNAWALMVVSVLITWVIYRREFHSPMLAQLLSVKDPALR